MTLAKRQDWSVGEYRAMLQATSQVNDWKGALWLLAHMERYSKPRRATTAERPAAKQSTSAAARQSKGSPAPDAAAFAHAIAACARAGEAETADRLLHQLRRSRVAPEVRSCNMVITSFARKGEWEQCLRLLTEMHDAAAEGYGPAPTVVSCNAALNGCSKAGRWREALQLLDRMRSDGPPPDVVSLTTAATACQRAKQWVPALELLEAVNASGAADSTPSGGGRLGITANVFVRRRHSNRHAATRTVACSPSRHRPGLRYGGGRRTPRW